MMPSGNGLDPLLKDIFTLIGSSVTIIGGFVAATLAIYNSILNRKIREGIALQTSADGPANHRRDI